MLVYTNKITLFTISNQQMNECMQTLELRNKYKAKAHYAR